MEHTVFVPIKTADPGPIASAAILLGPCSVRVLDSSLDEFPDLLSALRFAERTVDHSHLAKASTQPLWAKVYDRHGLVATIEPRLAISE